MAAAIRTRSSSVPPAGRGDSGCGSAPTMTAEFRRERAARSCKAAAARPWRAGRGGGAAAGRRSSRAESPDAGRVRRCRAHESTCREGRVAAAAGLGNARNAPVLRARRPLRAAAPPPRPRAPHRRRAALRRPHRADARPCPRRAAATTASTAPTATPATAATVRTVRVMGCAQAVVVAWAELPGNGGGDPRSAARVGRAHDGLTPGAPQSPAPSRRAN